jgi:hypothetical protein
MGMTPDEYFSTFVQGNHGDCLADPGCVRRAFNAAVSATHMADHYFAYTSRHQPRKVAAYAKLEAFIEYVEAQTDGCFRDIKSIANAYKHLYERQGRTKWSIASAGAINSITFEAPQPISSIRQDLGSRAHDGDLRVVFRRRDRTQGVFLPTLERVTDFWLEELYGVDA